MIILENTEKNDLFTEGMIDDALSAANIDTDQVRDEWNQASGVIAKGKSVDDTVIGKIADRSKEIDNKLKSQKVGNHSIVARARNSVLQFPIYVSQGLRVNEAHIIAGLFERVYTTLVQTVLAQNPYISEDEANNLVFLKHFHTNIKEAADVVEKYYNEYFEPIDDIDQMISESVFLEQKLTENCSVTFRWMPKPDNILIQENARLIEDPLKGFAYFREDGPVKKDDKDRGRERIDETSVEYNMMKDSDVKDTAKALGVSESEFKDIIATDISKLEKAYGKDIKANKPNCTQKEFDKEMKQKMDKAKDIKSNYKKKGGQYFRVITKQKAGMKPAKIDAPKILRDADIKKINGMLPYTIEAEFRIKGKDGRVDANVKYIIGIKSVLHMIRIEDLGEDLRELVTGNIKKLQKVRYKTGEISFMDYLFNMKQIKKDAAKSVNYNKKWLNTLKRLAEYRKMNGSLLKTPAELLRNGDIPIPNGTLILTQPDVTSLTDTTGIDLSQVSNAKRLANSLFLIAVAIVDSSAGTMKVLFTDSDNNWDVQSLSAIDAELSKTDNSKFMSELNKMVNKR